MFNIIVLIIICITIYLCYRIYKFVNTSYRVKTLIPSQITGNWMSSNSSIDYFQNYKLCDFFVNSSYHSSFIGNLQYDYLDINMIKYLLLGGVRFLEFTIMASDLSSTSYPIVSNGIDEGQWTLNINYLTFDEVCYSMQKFAFQNYIDDTNTLSDNIYPLFIYLNVKISDDIRLLNEVSKILQKYFGNRLLFSNTNMDLANTPVRKLLNKVIVFSSQSVENSTLENIVYNNVKSIHYTEIPVINKEKDVMTDYNKHNLTIVYPNKSDDVTATNYDIMTPVSYGCQFIALNYQVKDSNLEKYQKMFTKRPLVLKKSNLRDDGNVMSDLGGLGGYDGTNVTNETNNNILGLHELYVLSAVSLQSRKDSGKTMKYNPNSKMFEYKDGDSKLNNNDLLKIVAGIDPIKTVSFQSLSNPGKYLTINDGLLQLLNTDLSEEFKKNSSFYPIRKMDGTNELLSFTTYDKVYHIVKTDGNQLGISNNVEFDKYFIVKSIPTTKYQIIKDYNNRIWTIVSGNFIQCLDNVVGTQFRIIKLDESYSYIQTVDGKYVSYDGVNNIVLTNKPFVENTEKFTIIEIYDGIKINTFDNKEIASSTNGILSINSNGNNIFRLITQETI